MIGGKGGGGIKGPRVKFLSALGSLLGFVSTYVHTFIPPLPLQPVFVLPSNLLV